MIIRNAPEAKDIVWSRESNPRAVDIARRFLFGEAELLHLTRARASAIDDIEDFLHVSAELPVTVDRSPRGDLLIMAAKADESLLITGKTAEVLRAYIDDEPVSMQDRSDMTVRRSFSSRESRESR